MLPHVDFETRQRKMVEANIYETSAPCVRSLLGAHVFDKCILHIGTEKTGTTSIQTFLRENRNALLRQGYYVPQTMGSREHVRLVHLFAQSHKSFSTRRTLGLHTVDKVEAHQRALDLKVRAEMQAEAQTGRTLLISAERFFTMMTEESELSALRAFLYEFCHELKIVTYVRPQHEFAISMFSTNLKNGGRQKVIYQDLNKSKLMARKCDYARVLSFWEKHFPDAEFNIRRFVRSELVYGDSVADFSHVTGINTQGLVQPKRQNESLNWKAQLFLMKLNKQVDNTSKKTRSKSRIQTNRILEQYYSGTGILPSRAASRAFFEQFSDSNERLRYRFFPNSETLFDVSFDKYPEKDNKYRLEMDEAFEIFSKIVFGLKI